MSKIYVFDMGNVLTKPTNLRKVYEESESKCEYPIFKKLFYDSYEATAVYKGMISDYEFFNSLKEKTGSEKTSDELRKLYIKNKSGVYKDTIDIIKYLKDMRNTVCLLSNLKEVDYEYLSNAVDMSLFDIEFLSYEMGMAKPETDIYEKVIDRLGTSDFYFFDDTLANVEEARRLGIDAYQVDGNTISDIFVKQKLLLK